MYSFGEEMVTEGDITAIWQAVTDAAAWPSWDPHEEKARLDGPFAPGIEKALQTLRDHRGRAGADVVGTGRDPVREPARR